MSELDIKAAAKARGVTMNELAARLNITRQSLYAVIIGNPKIDTLQAVAAAIGCDVVDLFTNTPNSGECRCPVCGAALRLTVK